MRFDVITVLPELLAPFQVQGVCGRAVQRGLVTVQAWNPRSFTHDVHQTVDDRPYGGGPGMVMLAQPLADCLKAIREDLEGQGLPAGPTILMSPSGPLLSEPWLRPRLDASRAGRLVQTTLICGRYEGIDQRFIDRYVDEELRLADVVLSGGEIAALAVMDAWIRRLPGVLGDPESAEQDSFVHGMLDHPHYTRPEVFEGQAVPDVLLSGHHGKIADWRAQQAKIRTAQFLANPHQNPIEQPILWPGSLELPSKNSSRNCGKSSDQNNPANDV